MNIDRPLWAAGALLSPQQFQQQARWEAWTNEQLAHWPWRTPGVSGGRVRPGCITAG